MRSIAILVLFLLTTSVIAQANPLPISDGFLQAAPRSPICWELPTNKAPFDVSPKIPTKHCIESVDLLGKIQNNAQQVMIAIDGKQRKYLAKVGAGVSRDGSIERDASAYEITLFENVDAQFCDETQYRKCEIYREIQTTLWFQVYSLEKNRMILTNASVFTIFYDDSELTPLNKRNLGSVFWTAAIPKKAAIAQ